MKRLVPILFLLLILSSCNFNKSMQTETEVSLKPGHPGDGISLRWSPKGEKLSLTSTELGMETLLPLGPTKVPPVKLILSKSDGKKYYDRLSGDWNRNGILDDDSVLTTTPSEQRGKIWSSFQGIVEIPFDDSLTHESWINPYPLAFWYVFDPLEETLEEVIRYSRRGWMEGVVEIDSMQVVLLVTEMKMDGIFDENDSWAIAPLNLAAQLYSAGNSRSCTDHGWLLEKAYKLTAIDPSGRSVTIETFDPGVTRDEETAARDAMAVDRNAPRSGKRVSFLHDYSAAKQTAKSENKPLLLDFETTWCGPCKQMDQWVYTADPVVEKSIDLVAVKIDGDEQRDLVKKFKVSAYPTIILLGSDGVELRRVVGYQSVKQMEVFLTYTGQ